LLKRWSILLVLLVLLSACSEKNEITSENTGNSATHVEAIGVEKKDLPIIMNLVGQAAPDQQIPLMTLAAARMETIHIKTGQTVNKGDKLFTLNNEQALVQLEQAQLAANELEQAAAEAEKVKNAAEEQARELQQQREAFNQSIQRSKEKIKNLDTNKSPELEEVKDSLLQSIQGAEALSNLAEGPPKPDISTASLDAQLAQANASVRQAEKTVEASVITAPADGIISELLINEGAIASPSQPLGVLVNGDQINATFPLNDFQINEVDVNMKADVEFEGINDTYTSQITSISPTVDPNTGTYKLIIPISNDDMMIKGGMTATAKIHLKTLEDALQIPSSSILYEENKPYVFVIRDQKAFRQSIKVGIETEDVVQVVEGIEPEDQVVTNGKEDLIDGASIIVRK
jgi:HlyD family secretion protein